jgi:hypothetical protein
LQHVAQLAIINNGAGTLEVKTIRIAPLSSQNAALPVNLSVSRITVQPVNGTDVTPIKLDSATANLPAQVQIKMYPDAAVGSRFSMVNIATRQNTARVNQAVCARSFGEFGSVALSGSLVRNFRQDLSGTSQPIVLNEGQGLNIQAEQQSATAAYSVLIEFYTSDGSYMLNEYVYPLAVNSLLTIWNGVGSGRVISIKTIAISEILEDTIPYFVFDMIGAARGGNVVTPIKMDSSSPDTVDVDVRSNCLVDIIGFDAGAIIVNSGMRKMTRQTFGIGLSQTDVSFGRDARDVRFADSPIVLRQGVGIAIIQKNYGGVGLHEFIISYTFTPAVVGGSSEHAYGGAG